MATPMISAQNVHKSFGQLEVLKGIDLEVQPGEVACLLGPSGSGKSTFLRCVNHLDKATAGRLYVDGELIGYREKNGTLYEISEKEAAEQRSDIGMVFQSFNLFPHRTVIENIIEAPVQVKKIPEETARARAMQEFSFQVFEAFTAATVLYVLINVVVIFTSGWIERRVAVPGHR